MAYIPPKPNKPGIHVLADIPVEALMSYIDWRFFFMAWRLTGKYTDIDTALCECGTCSTAWLQKFPQADRPKAQEALNLYKDALEMLREVRNNSSLKIQGIIGLFPAKNKNEGIVFFHEGSEVYLPTLRQQEHNKEGVYYSLCDFVSPQEDFCGTFAVTVHGAEEMAATFEKDNDQYKSILIKTLADRLAEAAAEWLHEQIRKHYWGYAAAETLTVADMLKTHYTGIRPAVGYPSLPDQSVIFDLKPVLPFSKIGIQLTENGAMYPNASVCGIVISHPQSRYFNIGKIDRAQLQDYATRRGKSADELQKWLAQNLA